MSYLVITRKTHEKVLIGQDVIVNILEAKNNQVKLGIYAPDDTPVDREEIREKKWQSEDDSDNQDS